MTEAGRNDIVITGMAAVIPDGPVRRLIGASPFSPEHSAVPKRLRRFCPESALWAIEASERALHAAGVSPSDKALRWGIYTGQNGYQHPDFYDLIPALPEAKVHNLVNIMPQLWTSRKINPFLVIHTLSNNLLGILSIYWNLKGDCGAFVRDEIGIASALQEAVFSLSASFCDIALVVNAGSHSDLVTRDFSASGCQSLTKADRIGTGACALILERREHAQRRASSPQTKITLLPGQYCRQNRSLDWLDRTIETESLDLIVHDLHRGSGFSIPISKKIRNRFSHGSMIDLQVEQPHKGCEGLAFNILVATQLNHRKADRELTTQTGKSLAISLGQNSYICGALIEG